MYLNSTVAPKPINLLRLIETRVVFEFEQSNNEAKDTAEINRNKSCIWILMIAALEIELLRLIETRVVFELTIAITQCYFQTGLIETRVVFELSSTKSIHILPPD